MIVVRWKSASRVVLTLAALFAAGGEAVASPYYTVTELGRWDPSNPASSSPGSSGEGADKILRNANTGERIPFPVSDGFAPVDRDKLPTLDGFQVINGGGWTPIFNPMTFPLRMLAANERGTVIGAFPHGGHVKGYPWTDYDYSYYQRQPDGSYGPGHYLGNNVSGDINGNHSTPWYQLNALDQILVFGGNLIDIGKNTETTLADLVSPEDRAKYHGFHGNLLSDNGSILVDGPLADGGWGTFLLTPPTPTPEPSTLALLVVAGAGVAYRRYRRG